MRIWEKDELVRVHADLLNGAASMRPQIYLTPKPMLLLSDTHYFPGLFVCLFIHSINTYGTPTLCHSGVQVLKIYLRTEQTKILDPHR